MKLLLINSVCGIESTGKIAASIAREYREKGFDVAIAYGRDEIPNDFDINTYRITSKFQVYKNVIKARLFDNDGFAAKKETKKFLKWVETFNPDIIWLHNLHGYYINIELLFNWLKNKPNIKVFWTLHDCWAFTGHCGCFSFNKCDKWKNFCEKCSFKLDYPKSLLLDHSKKNFYRKRECFNGVKDLTIITPSMWLSSLVKESFLRHYPIQVINNSIDLNIFKPTYGMLKSDLQITDENIVLGVANVWSERKGLNDMLDLFLRFNNTFIMILVGLGLNQIKQIKKQLDKQSRKNLYSYTIMGKEEVVNIVSPNGARLVVIPRTRNAIELAEIYTFADVFVNTTYEDNYPTVNLEAKACGTPVITYRTGGSVESVNPNNIVDQGDVNAVFNQVLKIVKGNKHDFI